MAELVINGSGIGNALQDFLMVDGLQAGDDASYQTCKTIYSYHPLGAKMVDAPIRMAQSQKRDISIPDSPEEFIRDAFQREWDAINADKLIANTVSISRIYGIGSIALLSEGTPTDRPVDYKTLAGAKISFNVLDPLNTSGSLVLNQNPNAMDFQKHAAITVSGQPYHRSRSCTVLNEQPIYIEYSRSAFGYVGRSVYQRGLFPLKSFVQTMVTDDMISRKAGVIVAKMKPAGSIVDNIMSVMAGVKRALLKEAATNNVISISTDEEITAIDLQNIDKAGSFARTNIIKNIATSADMPAVLLENETLTEGFGEGTEDAKNIARYIDRVRIEMKPLYDFFDKIVWYRAWNPEFYKIVQQKYPEQYGKMGYTEAFYRWTNSFTTEWPNLLKEPDSEAVKTDEVKLRATIAAGEVLLPILDPDNRAVTLMWIADNFNENKLLFPNPLVIDMDLYLAHAESQAEQAAMDTGGDEEGVDTEPKPKNKFADAETHARIQRALADLGAAVGRLPGRPAGKPRAVDRES